MTAQRQLAYWSIGLLIFLYLVFVLGDVLLPFVLGMAIAYFLDPAADKLEDWGLPRWAAATVLTVIFLVAVVAFLLLLAPLLQAQIIKLVGNLPKYVELLRSQAEEFLALVQAKLSRRMSRSCATRSAACREISSNGSARHCAGSGRAGWRWSTCCR